MANNALRSNRGNFDKNEEDRIRRIRTISQGFVLKKFRDPAVTLAKKYELAEKIFLANIKVNNENGDKVGETKIIIIRDDKRPVVIEQKIEESSGRTISFNA